MFFFGGGGWRWKIDAIQISFDLTRSFEERVQTGHVKQDVACIVLSSSCGWYLQDACAIVELRDALWSV